MSRAGSAPLRRSTPLVALLVSLACGGPGLQELFDAKRDTPSTGGTGDAGDSSLSGALGVKGGALGSGGTTSAASGHSSSEAGEDGTGGPSSGGTDPGGTDSGGTTSGGTGPGGTSSGGTTSGGTSSGGQTTGVGGLDASEGGTGNSGAGGGGCVIEGEICDGLDNDCDDVADGADICPESCVGRAIDDRIYMFCKAKQSFNHANSTCDEAGMHLLWITSEEENAAVVEALEQLDPTLDQLWIGASDLSNEGRWHWVTADRSAYRLFWTGGPAEEGGRTASGAYANWESGRPNDRVTLGAEDCASMSLVRSPGQWNDEPCNEIKSFVCEAPESSGPLY